MADISELQDKVLAFRNARDWQQFHTPKDVTMSLLLEAAELMEHFQWKNPEEIKEHLKHHKTEVADELADVFYWVLLIAHDFDIDLSSALDQKLAKNALKYPVERSRGRHTKYTEL